MKKFLSISIATLLLFACNSNKQSLTNANADDTFHSVSEAIITGYLAWRPANGVGLGFHQYDGLVTDLSKASIAKELERLKGDIQKLAAIDTNALSAANFYDYRILRSAINYEIFNIEDIAEYTKNPMTYAGAVDVTIYAKRNFAPLESRVKSIIAIEKAAPAIYAAAKANLNDTLAKPYIETAIAVANGSADFLSGDLVVALKDLKNDSLKKAFTTTNNAAVAQIKAYVDYLKKEKLPKATLHYAIGVANYKKMLLYSEGLTMEPDSILAIGLKKLKEEQAVFNAAAKTINPNKKPIDVFHDLQKEHPTAENLIPDARKNMEAIRQFLIDKSIITMPSNIRVKVEETPQFARATSTASMDSPGPFETVATEAYYYITPVDPTWTAKQKEDWLSVFNHYSTINISIHEAYPGHYTNFLHLNASKATKIEKMFGSYAFVEGWAHYCEKMMADAGYGHNRDTVTAAKFRLTQSADALLRLCRLCVSIKTHCHGISVDEGTKFLMDNWYQGDKPSRQEALRGTFDPGYLYYTIGKLEILKLREDYQKQEGTNYSLKKFNDEVLNHGLPQLYLLREVMLKDKSIWKKVL